MKAFEKLKRNKGFSLAELLAVVAILVVVMGFAVPGLVGYQRDLRLQELDDNARAIFMAAQSSLTGLRTASSADRVEVGGTELSFVPAGFPSTAEEGGEVETGLHYVNQETAATLLPAGTIESQLEQGCYVVEYNPKTGAVYAVFYAESAFDYTADTPRTRSARKTNDPMLGYYGGSEVDRPEVGQLPMPQVTLVNAEELLLEVSLPAATARLADDSFRLEISVSSGATSAALVEEGTIWQGNKVTVALDSYNSYNTAISNGSWSIGKGFQDWNTGITPGSDLTVTVRLTYVGTEAYYLPQEVSLRTNSLFASVSGQTATVAYARHLQNLDVATSGVSGITSAVQTREIDFNAADASPYSWYSTYGDKAFTPINNTSLSSYDGRSLPIRNLNAAADANGNSGLFGIFGGRTLDNIILVDARATGTDQVGVLAGVLNSVAVTNCQVYLENGLSAEAPSLRVSATGNAGGLAGLARNCNISKSFASTVVDGTMVGGLVGYAQGGTITSSYAAGYLTGDTGDTVGALLGTGENTTITSCYAAGTIAWNPSTAAGLVAAGSGNIISDSYVAVEYEKSVTRAYGVAPDASNIPYLNQSGVNYVNNSGDSSTASDIIDLTLSAAFRTDALDSETFPYNLGERDATLYPPYPYPMLVDAYHYGDWLADSTAGYLVYYERYADGTYGFFGSWTDDNNAAQSVDTLQNAPGTIVVEDGYAVLGEAPITSLSWRIYNSDSNTVALTGSTVRDLGTTTISGSTWYVAGLPWAAVEINAAATNSILRIDLNGTTAWFNPHFAQRAFNVQEAYNVSAPSALLVRSPRQLYNVSLYSGSYFAFSQELDLDFATYESYGSAGAAALRTIAPITNSGPTYNGNEYAISNLTVTAASGPVGLFAAIAGGGSLQNIRLVNVTATNTGTGPTGTLVGELSANITNCTAVNCRVNGGAGDTGGLVGMASSCTITDCGIRLEETATHSLYQLYEVTCPVIGTGNVGGLVGYASSLTAKGSYAAVKVTGAVAGGLIGTAENGTYDNCYASGHTIRGEFISTTESGGSLDEGITHRNITGTQYAGGLVGRATGGTYTTCYATGSVSCPNGSAGLFLGGIDGYGISYGESCYSLSEIIDSGEEYDLPNLGNGVLELDAPKTTALFYDETLPETYSYAFAVDRNGDPIPHYGDWKERNLGGMGIFYWEREGTEYHIYAITWDLNTKKYSITDDLCKLYDEQGISEYGYGYFYREAYASHFLFNRPGYSTFAENRTASTAVTEFLNENLPNQDLKYASVAFTSASLLSARTSTETAIPFSLEFTAGELSGYDSKTIAATVNPDFAVAIRVPEYHGLTSVLGSAELPYQIRTISQFQNIASGAASDGTARYLRSSATNIHFNQTHDLDGADVSNFVPVGIISGTRAFASVYNGNSYRILELNIEPSDSAINNIYGSNSRTATKRFMGLFGVTLGARISNVILYSPSGTAGVTVRNVAGEWEYYGAGALVGCALSGTSIIENCAVAGYTITDISPNTGRYEYGDDVSYGGAIGGLMGWSNLQLCNCQAEVDIVLNPSWEQGVLKRDRYMVVAGGLVGSCAQTIENCYAGGTITYRKTSETRNLYVGGLVGNAANPISEFGGSGGALRLANCYSYVSMLNTTGGNVDRRSIYAVAPGSNMANCYYLNHDRYLPSSASGGTATGLTYDEMRGVSATGVSLFERLAAAGFAPAQYSHSVSSRVTGIYPFPAIVKATSSFGGTEFYVHHGDWPTWRNFRIDTPFGQVTGVRSTSGTARWTFTVTSYDYKGDLESSTSSERFDSTPMNGKPGGALRDEVNRTGAQLLIPLSDAQEGKWAFYVVGVGFVDPGNTQITYVDFTISGTTYRIFIGLRGITGKTVHLYYREDGDFSDLVSADAATAAELAYITVGESANTLSLMSETPSFMSLAPVVTTDPEPDPAPAVTVTPSADPDPVVSIPVTNNSLPTVSDPPLVTPDGESTNSPEVSPTPEVSASPEVSGDPGSTPSADPEVSASPEGSGDPEANPNADPEVSPSADPETSPSADPEPGNDPEVSPSLDPDPAAGGNAGEPPIGSAEPTLPPETEPEAEPSAPLTGEPLSYRWEERRQEADTLLWGTLGLGLAALAAALLRLLKRH